MFKFNDYHQQNGLTDTLSVYFEKPIGIRTVRFSSNDKCTYRFFVDMKKESIRNMYLRINKMLESK